MRWILWLALASVMVSFLSCASIVDGDKLQPVTIRSTPTSARLVVKDKSGEAIYDGRTPAQISLKRGDGYFSHGEYTVEIAKEGFETRVIKITGTPNGWYLGGNFGFGGLIGWLIVDPITGAMWDLKPNTIAETLKPSYSPTELNVMTTDQLPAQVKEQMQPLPVMAQPVQPAQVVEKPQPQPTPQPAEKVLKAQPELLPEQSIVSAAMAEDKKPDNSLAQDHFNLAVKFSNEGPRFKESAQFHYSEAVKLGYPRDAKFEQIIEWTPE